MMKSCFLPENNPYTGISINRRIVLRRKELTKPGAFNGLIKLHAMMFARNTRICSFTTVLMEKARKKKATRIVIVSKMLTTST
jgi:CRISPR/Cas system CMR-associated protein Cmr3 (group 5 of RAMP superfamily)